ncbi:hypothetical protein LOTGIDRAFT_162745 [Lottia gigantea]|uniref:C-type lectin domain-containing protein n=1 Tax=Lottia gigantea TaxID=225164 RepID=V4BTZ2_LOTGI|nr:hypothetical protein LOTGIDRAFT_162745 [Lottia gigantea]ESO92439.1 hypothetical protein LOTGIDRAFT_162745 [Lottia gigantea]
MKGQNNVRKSVSTMIQEDGSGAKEYLNKPIWTFKATENFAWQKDSGSCCRDFERLNESVTSMLIRVTDLEAQNKRREIKSRRLEKEMQRLRKLTIPPKCPQGFKPSRHSCYLLVKNEKTKRNAARYCRRKSFSHLVRIQSEGEIERLTDYLEKENDVPSTLYTVGYLNGSLTAGTLAGDAHWVWSNSEPIKFSQWNKLGHLPANDVWDRTATCVVLVKTENGWVLKSEYCKENRAFICEKRKVRSSRPRRIIH